jgi:hypothetical protein
MGCIGRLTTSGVGERRICCAYLLTRGGLSLHSALGRHRQLAGVGIASKIGKVRDRRVHRVQWVCGNRFWLRSDAAFNERFLLRCGGTGTHMGIFFWTTNRKSIDQIRSMWVMGKLKLINFSTCKFSALSKKLFV